MIRSSVGLGALGLLAPLFGIIGQDTREVRLGRVTGETAADFQQVTSVRELADGSLLVADRRENKLFHVRLGGEPPRSIGRNGRGPNEFVHAGQLFAIGADSSVFTDAFLGRILLLDGPRIVGMIAEHREPLITYQGRILGADARGNLLGTSLSRAMGADPRSPGGTLTLRLGPRDRDSTIALAEYPGTVFKPYNAGRRTRAGMPILWNGNPFTSTDYAVLSADGWIAFARLDTPRVDLRSPDGRWIRGHPIPYAKRPVTDAERCFAFRLATAASRPCDVGEVESWPSVLPAFVTGRTVQSTRPLLRDARGISYLARTPTVATPGRRWDLIDRKGAYVGSLSLPDGQSLVGFGAISAFVLVTDDDGLQTIRRHDLPSLPSTRP